MRSIHNTRDIEPTPDIYSMIILIKNTQQSERTGLQNFRSPLVRKDRTNITNPSTERMQKTSVQTITQSFLVDFSPSTHVQVDTRIGKIFLVDLRIKALDRS